MVELSIVLVILGLLTGGILAGQSLIRAAELRSVTSDLQRYSTAIFTFRDKYLALPGDMTNATRFWGIRGGTTGNDTACWHTLGSYTGTCNGDGNGRIQGTDVTEAERYLVFQHLALAGLIEGSYTGASTVNNDIGAYAPINVPRGRLSNSAWSILFFLGPLSGDPQLFDNPYNINVIRLSVNAGYTILKPEEAWNIDTKNDDGKPGTGVMWVYKNTSTFNPACATSNVTSTAEYNVTNTSVACSLNLTIR